jgi:hypothetical protein
MSAQEVESLQDCRARISISTDLSVTRAAGTIQSLVLLNPIPLGECLTARSLVPRHEPLSRESALLEIHIRLLIIVIPGISLCVD